MDPCIRLFVIRFDFYGLYSIEHVTLDWALIANLVERWHLETHISFTDWGDDDHITRCRHHPRPFGFMDHQSPAYVTSMCRRYVKSR